MPPDVPPHDAVLKAQIARLGAELDKRAERHKLLDSYFTGACPLPAAIKRARVTKAYQMLMSFAQTNYGKLVIKAASSRMEVGGIRSDDPEADKAISALWQGNHMDAESKLGHDEALTHGRVFAVIEDPRVYGDIGELPRITLETAANVIVEYREGSRYDRAAALRRWVDDDGVPHATLYRPEGTFKFSGPKHSSGSGGTQWERRQEGEEDWPLATPEVAEPVVPVVEISTNRKLSSGSFGKAYGDFEGSIGLIDRINVLEFLRLVIAFTAGFPIRAVVGDEILYDDDKKPIAPFELAADVIAQFENKDTKLLQIDAADLKSFGEAIDHDVEALAGITQTPAYFLRSVPIQNVSADTIRASDTPLNARVEDHKPMVGEGWEETDRVAGRMVDIDLPTAAEVQWVNRESRSLSERADAAVKLNGILPWQALAEYVFDATQEQISRWESMRASDLLGGLIAAEAPAPTD